VSPVRHRGSPVRELTPANRATHPFRGLCPFSVFPAARSHIPPVRFHRTGYVAPLGFRTPATLCSPHDLPGLFHPGPAHGVSLRGLAPPGTPYALSHAVTLSQLDTARTPHRCPRALLVPRIPHAADRGLIVLPAGCPLGFLPLRGFLPDPPRYRTIRMAPDTFTRFAASAATLTETLAPQGTRRIERSRSLSRPAKPPWSFAPR
jgi:hypothetical protein